MTAGSLRDIHLFVAAYEERSFTAAARRENATQSGVSQHIRKLEQGFGVALFLRQKGHVVPTPAADSYYQRCIDVLKASETAARTVKSYSGGHDGEVLIGLMPTMTRCALAPVLAKFVSQHPNTLVRIVEGYSALLTNEVRAGRLDFAIVPAFAGAPGLAIRHFLRTPELLVSSAKSKLSHLEPIRLADLKSIKLVVPGMINTRRRTIETYCASNGVAIERLLELDAMLGTLDFLARTDWVAILPGVLMAGEHATDTSSGRLFTLNPIVSPSLSLDLVLIEPARRTLTPASATFLAILEEETVRLNERWTNTNAVKPVRVSMAKSR